MLSGQPLATSQNDHLPTRGRERFINRLIQVVMIVLLAVTGFIHWCLPVVHPVDMPGELTGGIILIPHDLLHLLFDLDGVGYFVLAVLAAGWLPLWGDRPWRRYLTVAGYAALTILAWIGLSDPVERGILDYLDKGIELALILLAIWMRRRAPRITSASVSNQLLENGEHVVETEAVSASVKEEEGGM